LSKSQLIKQLENDVMDIGISKTLELIKRDVLKEMSEKIDWEDKIPHNKRVLAKRIKEEMEEKGAEKFLGSVKPEYLEKAFSKYNLDIDKPDNEDEYTTAILNEAEAIGLENCFSSFSADRLRSFAKTCGLKVESNSQNVLMNSIMTLQNHKAPKKPKKKS